MKKIILLLFIGTKIFAQIPEKSYIKTLSSLSKYHNIYVVTPSPGKTNNFVVITNYSLYKYYLMNKKIYKKQSYKAFLVAVLHRKIAVDTTAVILKPFEVINPNLDIFKIYKKEGINTIIKKYTNPIEGRLRNNVLDDKTLNGLMQIMFNNNYFVSFSQYSGYYYFKR